MRHGNKQYSLTHICSLLFRFHGDIDTTEATELLNAKPPGTFLVRFNSTQLGSFALSYKDTVEVKHINLRQTATSHLILNSPEGDLQFDSIQNVVAMFKQLGRFKYPCIHSPALYEIEDDSITTSTLHLM
jgi:hypothetical protein